MRDRLLYIVKTERLSNLQFANEIGISPAAVTHILSGRNNPSLDIIAKIASRYPQYNLRWLILGEGEPTVPSFAQAVNSPTQEAQINIQFANEAAEIASNQIANIPEPHQSEILDAPQQVATQPATSVIAPSTTRLIVCFPDNTFTEYTSRTDK